MIRPLAGKVCALAALGAVLSAGTAFAEVTGGGVTGGNSGGVFELLDPAPAAAGPDEFQSPNLLAFDEQQDLLIDSEISLPSGLIIPVGSTISSHYVTFDPAQGSTLEGFVDFDEAIIAIIGAPPTLDASALLFGLPGTTYTVGPAIGPEVNPDMFLVDPVEADRLLVTAAANSPGDHVRVLTGVLVPEPGAMVLAALAIAAGATGVVRQV